MSEPVATFATLTADPASPAMSAPLLFNTAPDAGHAILKYQKYGAELANLVVPVVYGGHNAQSRVLLYGYKEPAAAARGDQRRELVSIMFAATTWLHGRCIEAVVAQKIGAVVTVPSTRQRASHPLPALTANCFANQPRIIALASTSQPDSPRTLATNRFDLMPSQPFQGEHVLILDDTWTTGARTQSMALSLRAAGAARVTILVLARWLSSRGEWPPTDDYLAQHPAESYDALRCPVTGSACPI